MSGGGRTVIVETVLWRVALSVVCCGAVVVWAVGVYRRRGEQAEASLLAVVGLAVFLLLLLIWSVG